jgi:hypothetical protein
MRPYSLLFPILSLRSALAIPTRAPVVFNDLDSQFALHITQDFLPVNDAKKVILQGKTNMQKWLYKGQEFIKQDGLMCE